MSLFGHVNGDEIFMTRWETSKRNTQLMLTLEKQKRTRKNGIHTLLYK